MTDIQQAPGAKPRVTLRTIRTVKDHAIGDDVKEKIVVEGEAVVIPPV